MKPVVLLVEDETSIREIVADTLAEAGYTCIPACNGSDAMRIIEAGLYRFDLLLSCIKMPGAVNGIQLADQFQACFPGVPVIIMSGHIGPETASVLKRDGIQVLVKPVRLRQVLNVVLAALSDSAARKPIGAAADDKGCVVSSSERSAEPKHRL